MTDDKQQELSKKEEGLKKEEEEQEEAVKEGEGDEGEVLGRTVFVEGLRTSVEKLAKVLRAQSVRSLVRRRDGYEITFPTAEAARECVERGLTVERRHYDAAAIGDPDLVTVHLHQVPAYVRDADVLARLKEMGATPVGELRRHTIEGGVETGRRRVLVRMPENTRSLPRAMTVKSACGRGERIELFHRNQRLRKNTR